MRSVSVSTAVRAATAFLICSVAVSSTTASAQTAAQESSETTLRSVWPTLDALWNARDAKGFSELFAVDGRLEFVDRELSLESRPAIHRHFAEQFPRYAPDVRHRTSVREVRDVAGNVRTVDGSVEILRNEAGGSAEPTVVRTFAIFAVMLQSEKGWKIHTLRAVQLSDRSASPTTSDTPQSRPAPDQASSRTQ